MTEYFDDGMTNNRIAAFDRRHGESIFVNGWFVYADGATRERDMYGALNEPPADPWERAKKIAFYHRIIFERAMKAFDEARQNYRLIVSANLRMPVCGPAPVLDEAIAELKQLRNIAKKAKDNHDKAVAAVEAARPDSDKVGERVNQQNRNDNEDLLAQIDKIEL